MGGVVGAEIRGFEVLYRPNAQFDWGGPLQAITQWYLAAEARRRIRDDEETVSWYVGLKSYTGLDEWNFKES